MAFKLTGDQYTGINLIQGPKNHGNFHRKRRVSELLASNIPEDEVLLMSSGRYACLVCKHHPTFDTIAMLSVHRAGQKHTKAAHTLMQQKQQTREELEKREQLQHQRGDIQLKDTYPLLAKAQAASKRAFQSTSPTVPCHQLTLKPQQKESKAEDRDSHFFSRKRPCEEIHDHGSSKKVHTEEDVTRCSQDIEERNYVFPWNVKIKKKPTEVKSKRNTSTSQKETLSTTTQRSLYMQRKSSGWLLNPDGTWSKDPDIEFDTDEEELPS